jgi:hypothetical protein
VCCLDEKLVRSSTPQEFTRLKRRTGEVKRHIGGIREQLEKAKVKVSSVLQYTLHVAKIRSCRCKINQE